MPRGTLENLRVVEGAPGHPRKFGAYGSFGYGNICVPFFILHHFLCCVLHTKKRQGIFLDQDPVAGTMTKQRETSQAKGGPLQTTNQAKGGPLQ